MSKKKILYTLNNARLAGTEKHVLLLTRHLDKDMFEPSVVCFSDGPLIDTFRREGVEAYPFLRNTLFDYHVARDLLNFIKEKCFDIVHSHCGHFSCVVAKLAGVRHIIETRHGLYLNYDQIQNVGLKDYWLAKAKARFVDLTLTVADVDKDILVDRFHVPANRVKSISNGLNIDELYSAENTESGIPSKHGHKVIGTVARFTEQKGLRYFIRAIKDIKKAFPETQFVVVGDGLLRDELVCLAQKLGLHNDIWFAGYRQDAISLMASFDIFVLPSLWEGMPYVVLEAMALKRPVVTTRVFGNVEVVQDGITGLLVPPRDSTAIAKAVIHLLENPEKLKAMGERGFERIQQHFSAETMTRNVEQTYLELLDG